MALLAGVNVTLKLVAIIGVCALAQDILANSSLVITLLKEEIHVLAQAQPLTVETFERIQGGAAQNLRQRRLPGRNPLVLRKTETGLSGKMITRLSY